MYTITQLKALCQSITVAIPEITGGSLLVIDEKNAVNQIKDKGKVVLMAVVPSSEAMGSLDRRRNQNAVLFFVLEKGKTNDPVDQIEVLQPIVIKLQNHLESLADTDCNFQYLDAGSTTIDPVHKEFGGYNGWMLTLVF